MRFEKEDYLRDMCEMVVDCPHSTPVWTTSGVIVLRNQNIRKGRLDLSDPSYTDEAHFLERTRRALPRAGDIVFTREAPMGEVCKIPEGLRCCLGQRQVLLRPKSDVDSDYLLYVLQSTYVQEQIRWNEGTGSTVSNVRIPVLEKLKIPRLGQAEQAVAAILAHLDQRMDVNRQVCQTLEQMAQAIFQAWFVDFLPVRAKAAACAEGRDPLRTAMCALSGKSETELGEMPREQQEKLAAIAALFPDEVVDSELGEVPQEWPVGKLSQFAQLENKSVSPGVSPETIFEHYSIPAFDSSGMPVFEHGASIKSNKYRVDPNAVLVSKLNPETPRIWLPAVKTTHAVCSTEFMQFVPTQGYGRAYLYLLMKSASMQTEVLKRVTGSTGSRQRAQPPQIAGLHICLPPRPLVLAFEEIVVPMLDAAATKRDETHTLAVLRDTLLPKLLSGEIDLSSKA